MNRYLSYSRKWQSWPCTPALEAGWWTSWTSPSPDSLAGLPLYYCCMCLRLLFCDWPWMLLFFSCFSLGNLGDYSETLGPWKNLKVWNTIGRFVQEILGHVLFRDKEIRNGAQFWGEDQNKRKLLYTNGGKDLYTFWEFYYLLYKYPKYKNSYTF